MSLRDWLIVIGIVIIAGILIDGYRRMRLARKDSLQMSRDMGGEIENTPLDDDYNPELPGGGARVVAPGIDTNLETVDDPAQNPNEEPIVANQDDSSDLIEVPITADQDSRITTDKEEVLTANAGKAVTEPEPKRSEVASQDDGDQEVLVINVDCKNNAGFAGEQLKQLLEACGLNHGDMSIFHRHEEDDLLSPIQFSVANAVEPGYFDPKLLDQLTTPGVSFFMSLPGPKDYMKAFDYMLETAQVFARNLDGELKDEHRSVMTAQTIEHSRQRIREFERKQLSKARA